MGRVCVSLAAAVLLAARVAAAGQPIVAVFDIESRATSVSPQTQASLSDLLAAGVAATGAYRTIPSSQIRNRLVALKRESHRDCYDQACQIELGRELAATKALSSRVVQLDRQCVLTLELYDLKTATTDFAHTTRGDCSAAALFSSLTESLKALGRLQRPSPPPRPPGRRKITVHVASVPAPAEALVDGRSRGSTPLQLELERGRAYRLVLRREDYSDVTRDFVAEENLAIEVPLALSAEGRRSLATTSEWIGLGFGPGYLNGRAVLAFNMRLGTIKWYRFFWTIFEVNPALGFGNNAGGPDTVFNLGTRAGFPLYLGRRGQHQLLFGLGAHAAMIVRDPPAGSDTAESRTCFSLSPSLDYSYNAYDGAFPLGLGVRAHLPVARGFEPAYPAQLLATVNVGLSLSRLFGRRP